MKFLKRLIEINNFKNGLYIEDYKTAPAKLRVVKYDDVRNTSLLVVNNKSPSKSNPLSAAAIVSHALTTTHVSIYLNQ